MSSWSNEEILKFIDLYKTEPCIWNPKHENYKDRNKAQEAWNRLEYAMQVSVKELKKKKETLMTAFRMHYRKKLQSIKNNEVHKPIWVFYEPLASFLGEVYELPPHDSDNFASTSHQQDDEDEQEDINNCSFERKRVKHKLRMGRRYSEDPLELQEASKKMTNAFNTLNQALKSSRRRVASPSDEDDCDLYGRLLAKRLRRFSDTERQEIMYELDGLLLNRYQRVTEIITVSNNSDLSDG